MKFRESEINPQEPEMVKESSESKESTKPMSIVEEAISLIKLRLDMVEDSIRSIRSALEYLNVPKCDKTND